MAPTREARHVTDRAYDPRGQDGTYAEDLGEGGAGSLYLGFDALVFRSAIFRSSVLMSRRPSEASRRRTREEEPCGRMPRKMRAARWAESVPAIPPGRRSRRSP